METKTPPWLRPLLHRLFLPKRDAIEFMQQLVKYEDVIRLPVLTPSLLVNDPAAVHHILLSNQKNYTKVKTSYSRLASLVGPGLLTTSGDDWQERRDLYQPKFHGKNLQQYENIVQRCTDHLIAVWDKKSGKQINVTNEMLSLGMNIMTQAFLGIDITDRSLDLVHVVHFLNQFAARKFPIFKWIPTVRNLRYHIHTKFFDRYLLDTLKNSPKVTEEPLLVDLLRKDEQGNFLRSDEYILGEAKNFFVAGHETTGNALSWALYLLVKNPYSLQIVQDEIDNVIGTGKPTFENIENLTYLEMVILETLRLYPPIWLITRRAIEEDNLAGYKVPANMSVNIITYLLHRHPQYWNQPDIFYPERFLPEASKNRPKTAFIPFGFGPRVCIGRQFAMMNMKMILARLIQSYRFSLPKSDYTVAALPLITLKAEQGIRLRIQSR